jgi:hypothetical protein
MQSERDLITGLKARTKNGRPDWDDVLNKIKSQDKGPITMFYCGNPNLAKTLRKKCEVFGINFRKEIF